MTIPSLPDDLDLRRTERPEFEAGLRSIRAIDIYSGCGGLTLGLAQACRDTETALDVGLALDFEADTIAVYKQNFPKASTCIADIRTFFDEPLGESASEREETVREEIGSVDVLIAGPPCQGHSDLNNHTRRNDPKNLLYLRVARAAEILSPAIVFIENVPTVLHDQNGVVTSTIEHLKSLGYQVAERSISLDALGLPQRRRRHALLALKSALNIPPAHILDQVGKVRAESRNLRWAIGDLADLEDLTGMDEPPKASAKNLLRMRWLLDNNKYDLPNILRPKCHQNEEHSYRSMYGRLNWDAPAQTITSGFGSIGQGRYMHPDKLRALTPHEAARIQGFPDYFDFSPVTRRASLSRMIANAVPPPLTRSIFRALIPEMNIEPDPPRDLDTIIGRRCDEPSPRS